MQAIEFDTPQGRIRLEPAVIPNPGGMLTEIDGVLATHMESGKADLMGSIDAYVLFRDHMDADTVAQWLAR